eukprot:Nitzschia sp. Nitz4//scaffold175_size95217//76442//78480//NITZ4_004734-RA/size95217-snap-gene-0.67-mRNA-1//1//CDS//3329538972//3776//frame0
MLRSKIRRCLGHYCKSSGFARQKRFGIEYTLGFPERQITPHHPFEALGEPEAHVVHKSSEGLRRIAACGYVPRSVAAKTNPHSHRPQIPSQSTTFALVQPFSVSSQETASQTGQHHSITMPILLGEAAAQRERIQTSTATSGVSQSMNTLGSAPSQSSAGYSSSNTGAQAGGAGSGVPPSVYIRANQEPPKAGSDGSNQAPAANTNSNEALIQQSHAELLRQLLQPQPAMTAPLPTPPVHNDTQGLQAALASFLNPTPQVQAQHQQQRQPPPPPQQQQQQQQPNQALMALDLLQILGLNQLQTPPAATSGGAAPAISAASNSFCKPASEPTTHFAVPDQGKRIPGSTRVPCRARGMPPDHCSESAYFWIHPDMAHGADLLCCYPSCREGGVKFRYCKVCKVPAAKRSFLFRHGHSNKKRAGRESPPVSSDAEEVSDNGASDGEKAKRNLTFHEDTKDSSNAQDTSSESKKKDVGEPVKKPSSPSLVSRESEMESSKAAAKKRRLDPTIDTQSTQSSVSSTSEDTRVALWRDLLYQRPIDDDEDKMSLWLMRIVQVSGTKGVRQTTTTTSPLSEPSSCGSNSAQQ